MMFLNCNSCFGCKQPCCYFCQKPLAASLSPALPAPHRTTWEMSDKSSVWPGNGSHRLLAGPEALRIQGFGFGRREHRPTWCSRSCHRLLFWAGHNHHQDQRPEILLFAHPVSLEAATPLSSPTCMFSASQDPTSCQASLLKCRLYHLPLSPGRPPLPSALRSCSA